MLSLLQSTIFLVVAVIVIVAVFFAILIGSFLIKKDRNDGQVYDLFQNKSGDDSNDVATTSFWDCYGFGKSGIVPLIGIFVCVFSIVRGWQMLSSLGFLVFFMILFGVLSTIFAFDFIQTIYAYRCYKSHFKKSADIVEKSNVACNRQRFQENMQNGE